MKRIVKVLPKAVVSFWILVGLVSGGAYCSLWGQQVGADESDRTEFFPVVPVRISEEAGPMRVRLVRPAGVRREISFSLHAVDVSAREGKDYEPLPSAVTFGPGERELELTIVPLDNTSVDGNRRFTLEASPMVTEEYPYLSVEPLTVWIDDNEQRLLYDPSFGTDQELSAPLLVFPDDTFLTVAPEGLFRWDADGRGGSVIPLEGYSERSDQYSSQQIQRVVMDSSGGFIVGGSTEQVEWFGSSKRRFSWIRHYSATGKLLLDEEIERFDIDHPAFSSHLPALLINHPALVALLPNGTVVYGGAYADGMRSVALENTYLADVAQQNLRWNLSFRARFGGEVSVNSFAQQTDGSLLVGGRFDSVTRLAQTTVPFREEPFVSSRGASANALIRVGSDGFVDEAFKMALEPSSEVTAVVVAPDDRVFIAGDLLLADGRHCRLLCLNSNGALVAEESLSSTELNGSVRQLLVDSARGWLYVVGNFDEVNGEARDGVARFHLESQDWDRAFVGVDASAVRYQGRVLLQSNGHLISRSGRILTDVLSESSASFVQTELKLQEGGQAQELLVERYGDSDQPLTLRLVEQEGGQSGVLEPLPSELTFAVGETKKKVAITPIDNGRVGPPARVRYSLESTNGDRLVSPRPLVNIHVRDNEVPNRLDRSFLPDISYPISDMTRLSDGRFALGLRYPFSHFDPPPRGSSPLALVDSEGVLDESLSFDLPSIEYLSIVALEQLDERWFIAGGNEGPPGIVPQSWLQRINLEDGSLDPDFSGPQLTRGQGSVDTVTELALQPTLNETRILVGGSFHVDGRVYGLVGLHSNGTIDESFRIGRGFEGKADVPSIATVEIMPDGTLLVGGGFETVDGVSMPALARLSADGRPLESFRSPFRIGHEVSAVYLAQDESIWVAGKFDGGDLQIVRVLSGGALDAGFVPLDLDGTIDSFLDAGRHGVYVFGDFQSVDGRGYSSLARLTVDGRLDSRFVAPVLTFPGRLIGGFLDSENGLVIGGHTGFFDGLRTPGLFRILPGADPGAESIQFHYRSLERSLTEFWRESASLQVWRAGNTEQEAPFGVSVQEATAELGVDFILEDTEGVFEPLAVEKELVLRVLDDGIVELDERFQLALAPSHPIPLQSVATVSIRDNELPVELDYRFSTQPGPNSIINEVWPLPDGKILVAGSFTQYGDREARGVARLKSDGSVDPEFSLEGLLDGAVWSMWVDEESIWLGGDFVYTSVDEIERRNLIRLNLDGSCHQSLASLSQPDGGVREFLAEPDGGMLIAGTFRHIDGFERSGVARLTPQGKWDPSFAAGLDSLGHGGVLVRQADGKVLLGGYLERFERNGLGNLIRFNADGTLDADFAPLLDSPIGGALVLPDQRILVGLNVSRPITQGNGNLLRFLPDGSVDETFSTSYPFGRVSKLLLDDQSILFAGSVFLQPHHDTFLFARLNVDGHLEEVWPHFGRGHLPSIENVALDVQGQPILVTRRDQFRGIEISRLFRPESEHWTRPTVNFVPSQESLVEPDGHVELVLKRFGDLSEPTQLSVVGHGIGSVSEKDFRIENELVTFAPLEDEIRVRVLALDDDLPEEDGEMSVEIASLTPGHVVGRSSVGLRVVGSDRDGGLDYAFRPVIERRFIPRVDSSSLSRDAYVPATVTGLAVQSDQSIIITGDFERINNVSVGTLVRLDANGNLDSEYHPVIEGASGLRIGMQSNDRLVVRAGWPRTEPIIRLLPDGSLDPQFSTLDEWDSLSGFTILPDDRIVVWGLSRRSPDSGSERLTLALLDADGVLDPHFEANGPQSSVWHASFQSPDKLILVGWISEYANRPVQAPVRIGLDGRLDDDFALGGLPRLSTRGVHLLGHGEMQIVHETFDSVTRKHVAEGMTLTQDGNRVADSDAWPLLEATWPLADGSGYVAGDGEVRGSVLRGLARTTPDGVLDPEFDVGEGLDGRVEALAVMGNGDLLVGGSLNTFNGIPVGSLIRIQGRPVLEIQGIRFDADGQVEIEVSSVPGRAYQLETSIDLRTWSVIDLRVAEGNRVRLFDDVDGDIGLYRVRALD